VGVSRVALLDVNLLVALFQADHIHHDLAHDWFADHRANGWATCAVTENGFVRVTSQQLAAMRPVTILQHFRKFCASGYHHFWSESVSLRDAKVFNPAFLSGHRQLTDIYLLGLANRMSGRLATFDRAIPLKAVVGATPDLLQVIAPTSG
jgi:toxin-antitoxin system PIN domain toxin